MNLRNLRLGVRLGGGFGIILAILAMMVVTGNVLTTHNKQKLIAGVEQANRKSTYVVAMKSALLGAGIAMRNMGLQSDVGQMEKEHARVKEHNRRYAQARDKLVALGLTDEEKKIVADIARLDQDIDTPFKEAMGQALAFNAEGAAKVISGRIDPLNQQAVAEMDKLVVLQQAQQQDVLSQSVAADTRLMVLLYALGLLALAIGGACAWLITRSITAPLNQAVALAQTVSVFKLRGEAALAGVAGTQAPAATATRVALPATVRRASANTPLPSKVKATPVKATPRTASTGGDGWEEF